MLDYTKRKQLTELMQKNFTDLDIERDEPFKYKSKKLLLIVDSVKLLEHSNFLISMFNLIATHKQIFATVDFLTAQTYADKNEIQKAINQVMVFQANKQYGKFIHDSRNFISQWGYIAKIKKTYEDGRLLLGPIKRKPRWIKKFLLEVKPDEFLEILFLVFVRNYDIVKKNLLGFLQMFQMEDVMSAKGTSSTPSRKEEHQMPKFSKSPYPKHVLEEFERQSKMH